MSDLNKQCYQMPVLTDDEKNHLIEFVKVEMEHWSPDGNYYPLFSIALAALTSKPIEYLTWHQGCRAPDDCEIYSEVAEKDDKSCDGSPAIPVYLSPPVPIMKQEGK